MDMFDWEASESAPKNYPMQIIAGSLFYHDGSGSLYVPDKVFLHHGWGYGRSSHSVGPNKKPLPNHLSITFFSYTEDQFYSGKFDLPYEMILKLFQRGYYSQVEEKEVTYHQIIVGVAPGGAVSVWLSGIDRTTEVFYGQAEKIDGDWKWINDNPKYTRDEYVRLELEETLKPEAREALHKHGIPFGIWQRYHKARYLWEPLFIGMQVADEQITVIKYFNGEQGYLRYPLEKDQVNVLRAVPSYMSFTWKNPSGKDRLFELTFREEEIFDAFDKLNKQGFPIMLEMRMEPVEGKTLFIVYLRNEKEAIKLKRTNLETYAVPEREE